MRNARGCLAQRATGVGGCPVWFWCLRNAHGGAAQRA
ncbi:hypothetical protein A2U01_0065473, partial [Trifolium medium]|nr:hypothetical protein [Trifolium medium]